MQITHDQPRGRASEFILCHALHCMFNYTVDVSETHQDLEPLLAHLLAGKQMDDWSPNTPATTFGKGCREPAKRVLESDSDEVSSSCQ